MRHKNVVYYLVVFFCYMIRSMCSPYALQLGLKVSMTPFLSPYDIRYHCLAD